MMMKDTDRTRKQFKQRILLMDREDKSLKKNTFIKVIKTKSFYRFEYLNSFLLDSVEELENDQIYEVPRTISFCMWLFQLLLCQELNAATFKNLNCHENMVRVQNSSQ